MTQKSTILFFTLALIITGCSDSKTQEEQVTKEVKTVEVKAQESKPLEVVAAPQKKVYSIDEIYNSMCVECHSPDGSGNVEKLTPSMSELSEAEMLTALIEVENDDGHIIMEHNRDQIIKMGMEYSAKDMAKYMFEKFNK
ncbi:MAG: hypothetical protein U9Q40_00640 [Campylobacterota bacterium]|nr:hypothetical protein [Campylobacterota bacterium]